MDSVDKHRVIFLISNARSTEKSLLLTKYLLKFKNGEIPDAVQLAIMRGLVSSALIRPSTYHRKFVQQAVAQFALINPKLALMALCAGMMDVINVLQPSLTAARLCRFAFRWVTLVLVDIGKIWSKEAMSQEAVKPLLAVFVALAGILGRSGQVAEKYRKKVVKRLKSFQIEKPELCSNLVDELLKIENISCLPLISLWIRSTNKNKPVYSKLKEKALERYLEYVLKSKTVVESDVLDSCLDLLKSVSHADLQNLMLPIMKKSMLRNPEIALPVVVNVLSSVEIDLSQFAEDLVAPLTGQLSSQSEDCRKLAVSGLTSLAKRCVGFDAVINMMDAVCVVLKGKQVPGQRQFIWQALEGVANHKVTGQPAEELSTHAIDQMVPILKEESNEASVPIAFSCLYLWAKRIVKKLPSNLVEFLKSHATSKTLTVLPKTKFYTLLTLVKLYLDSDIRDMAGQASYFADIFTGCKRQPIQNSQAYLVILPSALVLLRSASVSSEVEKSVSNTVVASANLFTSSLLLESFNDECWITWCGVVEILLSRYALELSSENFSELNRCVIECFLHQSYPVRKRCLQLIKKLLGQLDGASASHALLTGFESVLLQDKADSIQAPFATQLLVAISSVPDPEAESAVKLALASLKSTCIPKIAKFNEFLWLDILANLKIGSAEDFITNYRSELEDNVLAESDVEIAANKASLLSQLQDSLFAGLLVKCFDRLDDENIKLISPQDLAIMKTPEGQLFDTSVLDDADELNVKNMKRENKLYSFKEQLAELELRKELAQRRKDRGEVVLSAKQKEALKKQLQLESGIRKRAKEVANQVESPVAIVERLFKELPHLVMTNFEALEPRLVACMASSLLAKKLSSTLILLGRSVMRHDEYLGMLVGVTTLRHCEVACDVDAGWRWEKPSVAVSRSIAGLTAQVSDITPDGFQYSFRLISTVLSDVEDASEKDRIGALEFVRDFTLELAKNPDVTLDGIPLYALAELLLNAIRSEASGCQLAKMNLLLLTKLVAEIADQGVKIKFGEILFQGLIDKSEGCRETVLKALTEFGKVLIMIDVAEMRLCVACQDSVEGIKEKAESMWLENGFELHESTCALLLKDVCSGVEAIRQATSEALAKALERFPKNVSHCVTTLLAMLDENQAVQPNVDDFGRVVAEDSFDPWEARAGVGLALQKIGPLLPELIVLPTFEALVPSHLADQNANVRIIILEAATEIVKHHGKAQVDLLLPKLEEHLDNLPDSGGSDVVRQCLVVLLGTLAQHLDPEDNRVRPILARLIEVLSTPSQQVQEAVAKCLPPLIPAVKDQASALSQKLLLLLLEAEQYGERRGAAYGLAGLVKGLGILSLKQLEIMNTLVNNVQDKKNSRHREGALLAFEMLSGMLGRLFEPYIVHIMQHLLLCLGDNDANVRQAAEDCARAVMKHLSAHGVKLVLPALLSALEQDSWRTKAGSVELLGTMAYCAPRQLSSCLPSVVPKLVEVLADTHNKVQKAAQQALKQIGHVIRNPEVQVLVPQLLSALADPAHKTQPCMQALQKTSFLHYIDAPSLALIMPVIHRAFQDRSSESRKMAAQIMGNVLQLTDQKDVEPYLDDVIPGLQKGLLDPAPDVRAVSARAFGALVKGFGDQEWETRKPWFDKHLCSQNPVDRSGAAQGMSEILGALGELKLQEMMPKIIAEAETDKESTFTKDGYLQMYIFLPGVFGEKFLRYLSSILPSLLKALADETEYVRESALRGGQKIITSYCQKAIPLILPQLEQGLMDDNWRIRHSSVQLLGDLLFEISGVTGKMSTEGNEDESFGTEKSSAIVTEALGVERRNYVLAGLYMARNDTARLVSLEAGHIWKVIVSNTPRTIREILPLLFNMLLTCLASSSEERQQIAARCLGELVRKLGDRILVEIIPVLEEGLKSEDSDQRQGVCIALSEIMNNTTREMVQMYADQLVPTVKAALADPLPEVRQAAARSFDVLFSTVGASALDNIITPLMDKLATSSNREYILDGLQKVLAVKSRHVLPYLIPKLTAEPVNCYALAKLASVSGEALSKHLDKILPSLITSLAENFNDENMENCSSVILSISDESGLVSMFDLLLMRSYNAKKFPPKPVAALLATYMQNSKVDLDPFVDEIIVGLLKFYQTEDLEVNGYAAQALDALFKRLGPKEMISYVPILRKTLRDMASNAEHGTVSGFTKPAGVQPILAVFREGLLNGPPDVKEQAADGLGDVVRLSDPGALRPHVVSLTGPLIRILGDRFSANTKISLMKTLSALLDKVALLMKPFLPQLQSTFLKALADGGSRGVRQGAAQCLGRLSVIHSKPGNVINELINQINEADNNGIKETLLMCIRGIVNRIAGKLSANEIDLISGTLVDEMSSLDRDVRVAAGAALGTLVVAEGLPQEQMDALAREILDEGTSSDWEEPHGRITGLQVALATSSSTLLAADKDAVRKRIMAGMTSPQDAICQCAIRCCGIYMESLGASAIDRPMLQVLVRTLNHQSAEVKQVTANALEYLAETLDMDSLKLATPMLVNGTKEKSLTVRTACEEALIFLLHLDVGTEFYENYVGQLDSGIKESLVDVYTRALLKKTRSTEGLHRIDSLDDTGSV